jgi:hypothetical protein
MPTGIDPSNLKPCRTSKETLRVKLINYVLTEFGERLYVEDGLGLRNILFDNITDDTLDEIGDNIRTSIEREFENEIVINEVTLQSNENNLNIVIDYNEETLEVNL